MSTGTANTVPAVILAASSLRGRRPIQTSTVRDTRVRQLLRICSLTVGCVLLMTGCGIGHPVRVNATRDVEIHRVAVVFPRSGNFEVQYDRTRQTALPAVVTFPLLYGIMGYATATGYNELLDDNKKAEIAKFIDQLNCSDSVARSTITAIRSVNGIEVDLFEKNPAEPQLYDAVAEFSLIRCGFRLVEPDSELLFPYVTVAIKVTARDGYVLWKDTETTTGQEGRDFPALLSVPGLAQQLLEEVLHTAGERLGDGVVYQ